jgi:glycosyltransferase involved in cell wall biosynthesis
MNCKIRLLWYLPTFELGFSHPSSIGALAISKALAHNDEISYIGIASVRLKSNTRLSEKIDLISVSQNPFFTYRDLREAIAEKKINLVQERLGCHYLFNDWGILAGNDMGLPTVGLIYEYPPTLLSKLLSYIRLRHTLKICSRLLIINRIILQNIPLRKDEINKVKFFSCGYDLPLLPSNNVCPDKELPPINKKIVGYFGDLSKNKGVDIMLDLIRYTNDTYLFLIAGNGPLGPEVKRVARLLPEKCKYLGRLPQKDVYQIMKICDVTLALYRKELRRGYPQCGSPMKVFDSLAVGTPVIISKPTVYMLPQEISDLCIISDLELNDIINKIEMVCATGAHEAGRSLSVDVLQKYSWDYMAKKVLIPLYRNLLT